MLHPQMFLHPTDFSSKIRVIVPDFVNNSNLGVTLQPNLGLWPRARVIESVLTSTNKHLVQEKTACTATNVQNAKKLATGPSIVRNRY